MQLRGLYSHVDFQLVCRVKVWRRRVGQMLHFFFSLLFTVREGEEATPRCQTASAPRQWGHGFGDALEAPMWGGMLRGITQVVLIGLGCHQLLCTKDGKIFPRSNTWPSLPLCITGPGTCCKAWAGECSHLFCFPSSEKAVDVLC